MNGTDIIEAMKARHGLGPDARAGIVASFGKNTRVEKAAASAPFEIVSLATTDDLDLEGERVLPDGADWSYLDRNRNLFLDHAYDSPRAVAKLRSLKRTGNGWLCRGALLPDMENPYVRAVKVLAEAGGIGMSIGFTVIDGGVPTAEESKKYPGTEYIIRRWKGIEISYTAMPCNVACQSSAVVYGDEEKSARAREILTKAKVPDSLWPHLGVVGPRRKRIVVVH